MQPRLLSSVKHGTDSFPEICKRSRSQLCRHHIKRLIAQIKFSYQFTLCPFHPIFSPHTHSHRFGVPISHIHWFWMCLRCAAKIIEQPAASLFLCVRSHIDRPGVGWFTAHTLHTAFHRNISSGSCHQLTSNDTTLSHDTPSIAFPISFLPFHILYNKIYRLLSSHIGLVATS